MNAVQSGRLLVAFALVILVAGCGINGLAKNNLGQYIGGDPTKPSSTWPVVSAKQLTKIDGNAQIGTVFLGDGSVGSKQLAILYVNAKDPDDAIKEAVNRGMRVKSESQATAEVVGVNKWRVYFQPEN